MSTRPASSQSLRPPSAASQRPLSRVSSRPLSRISGRTVLSRHATRVTQLAQVLVSQVTGSSLNNDPNGFASAYQKTAKALEARMISSETLDTTEARIQRLAKKARINIQDNLAEALLQSWSHLRSIASDDFQEDDEIRLSNLPEQMQFLLELASPPLPSTLAHADIVLSGEREHPSRPTKLTWAQIMEEEPFEGDHWDGIFSKPSMLDGDTSPSLTPSESELVSEDELSEQATPEDLIANQSSLRIPSHLTFGNVPPSQSDYFRGSSLQTREAVEKLRSKQNWRVEWQPDAEWNRPFNLADPSTLAAAVERILDTRLSNHFTIPKVINEADAVRNILLLLQGIDSPITVFLPDDYGELTQASIVTDPPRIMHLSIASYRSILTEFCFSATKLQEMRHFYQSIYALRETKTNQRPASRTLEAFAESVDTFIHEIEIWCTTQDERITRARAGDGRPTVATLLSTHFELKEQLASTLDVIQDVLRQLVKQELGKGTRTHHQAALEKMGFLRASAFASLPTYLVSSRLLDLLLQAVNIQLAIGDLATASKLTEIFTRTAEPVWSSIERWLRNGIPVSVRLGDEENEEEMDPELFIRRRNVDLVDPNFWEQGYRLRFEGENEDDEDEGYSTSSKKPLVPKIFGSMATEVLAAGKAVGLLRAIGVASFADDFDQLEWPNFLELYNQTSESLLGDQSPQPDENTDDSPTPDNTYESRRVIDSLNAALLDCILPRCRVAQEKLTGLLLEECSMMEHFSAIENLFLMKRGDAMGAFCDQIFVKLDQRQKWQDLHFLNTSLRNVAEVDRRPWIHIELVQFYVRGGRERNNPATVRCFDGLTAEYAVPFPLTYLLRRPSAMVYCSLFVLLMQIRRAKTSIDRTLLSGPVRPGFGMDDADISSLYALRGKFSWFLNSFMNFIVTHVIDAHTTRFHRSLSKSQSLDEMITLHDKHMSRLQTLCFLQTKTAAVHRALLSILDLALSFSTIYTSHSGEDAEDTISSKPVKKADSDRRRRLRKKRRQAARRNVIGFSDLREDVTESSSSEEEIIDEEDLKGNDQENGEDGDGVGRPSLVTSISFAEDSFIIKVDRISEELEGQVQYVKKAVDVLGGGSSDVASTFGIFSFMLEEWNL